MSLQDENYPSYCKRIMELSTFYIKNGKVLKNRYDEEVNVQNEIDNYNNIVIEENGIVNIYCEDYRIPVYRYVINNLKEVFEFSNIEDIIKINYKCTISFVTI